MKLTITGSGGMLGRRLCELGRARGHEVCPLDLPDFDLTRPEEAAEILGAGKPDAVIHTAALTDVDACESRVAEAMTINGEAVGPLAQAAREGGAYFLAIGTDYVFDGRKGEPHGTDDATNPETVYGRSKLLGEKLALEEGGAVARLAWLFGPDGKNFVATIAGLLLDGKTLKVVDDQRGTPTFTRDVAGALLDLAEARAEGIWHVCNGGSATWYELAVQIARDMGPSAELRVKPCGTEEYPRPAPRPADSRLDISRFEEAFQAMPPWQDALTRYLKEMGWLAR